MVLVGYGINENRWRVRQKVDRMAFHSDCKHQSSVTSSDKESVIVSHVIAVCTLRKKKQIKTVAFLTRHSFSLIS